MGRRKEDNLEKVTLNIEKGTRETLAKFFPTLGWSVAARKILDQSCRRLNERASQNIPEEDRINDSIKL